MAGWVIGVGCSTQKPGELSRHSARQKPVQRNSWGMKRQMSCSGVTDRYSVLCVTSSSSRKKNSYRQNAALVDSNLGKQRVKRPASGQAHNKCRNEQPKRYIAVMASQCQMARVQDEVAGLVMESQPARYGQSLERYK